jgi:DNA/RNA endonuclease YhcR with UshA esterase domain
MFLFLLVSLAGHLLNSGPASAAVTVVKTLSGEDALQHLQETNTVCGAVASAKYVESSREKSTYLDLDRPYPNQTCAVVITASVRPKFKDPPETTFMGKNICVTGFITASHGKPQVIITDPSQITIEESATPATNSTGTGIAK